MDQLDYNTRILKLSDELGEIEKLILDMEVRTSFVSPPKNTIVATKLELKNFLDKHSMSIKKFGVIENELDFTIHRLTDRFDLSIFYESKPLEVKNYKNETPVEIVKRVCQKFLDSDLESVVKISAIINKNMKNDRVIPHSYLQRCTSSNKIFKSTKAGSTATLHFVIDSLIESGYMRKMELHVTRHLYETSADLFQILKK